MANHEHGEEPICQLEGCVALERLRGDMSTQFAQMQGDFDLATKEITAATKGVNNFRDFQADAKSKLAFIHGAVWAWSIILGLVLAALMLLLRQIAPAIRAIMIDYYQHHPDARYDNKSRFDPQAPVYAKSNESPQNAGSSIAPHY